MTKLSSEKQLKIRQMGFEASYLAACALHGTVPKLQENLDYDGLYGFCKFHSITSIVAMALEETWKTQPADPDVMKKWRQARDKAIRKNILLNAERDRILAHLESIGCWYMPLKGSLLQFDYPVFGMRQMNDNDILFDEAYQETVYQYMTGIGYEAVVYRKGNHDEYVRKPVYNIEMHKGLFMSSVSPELFDYYRDIKRLMISDPDKNFGYHMSENDFYIYLVAHAYKHYLYSGIGIRNLLDVWVYLSRHADQLDFGYIAGELRKFGAEKFEAECRMLSRKLLGNPVRMSELTQREQEVLDIYFSSGTFGTGQQAVENQLRSGSGGSGFSGKLRYLLQRLFPSATYMIEMEPELKNRRWMLPFAYLRRLCRGLFRRRDDIAQEMKRLRNASSDAHKK